MSSIDETKAPDKQRAKAAQEAPAKTVERFIYVGPTTNEGLKTATVFKGGIPKTYQKRFEANPEFASLFLPLGEYLAVKDEVEVEGTVLNSAYRTIKEKGVL